jgi:triphosphoribosyl-dephospho-CoA synthetase
VERIPSEPHPSRCHWYSSLLALGSVLEASLHPKPGAVTPCSGHEDKSFQDYIIHYIALSRALERACTSRRGDPLEAGLREYSVLLDLLPLPGSNVGLGEALLMIPLAAAASRLGAPEPGAIAYEASRLARASGPGAARVYYDLLAKLAPGHLGRYEGPIPGVGDGYPPDMLSVLEAARWDHVHGELLEGYPLTLETLERIEELTAGGTPLREALLEVLLNMLAAHGDTLIAARWGLRAYERARIEARVVLGMVRRGSLTIDEALHYLDRLWRPRGWNPGATLDILAAAIGLYMLVKYSILAGPTREDR